MSSFGNNILTLYTLIDGKTLTHAYSNTRVSDNVVDFQNLFRSMLSNYLESHGWIERNFLDLCIDHIEDIYNDKYDFIESSSYKIKE